MAQTAVTAPEQSKAPIIIGIVVVIALCLLGYFVFSKPTVPAIKPPTTPVTPGAKPAGGAIDAVVDPSSPTGYVDSGGVPVNQDGTDYTGDSNYVNAALSNFSKKLGF